MRHLRVGVVYPWSEETDVWMIGIQQVWIGEDKVHEVDVTPTVTSNRDMLDIQMRQELGNHFYVDELAAFVRERVHQPSQV